MQISVRSQTAAQTTLSWQPVAGAARYRILWSDRSGETVRFKTAGEIIMVSQTMRRPNTPSDIRTE